MHKQPLFQFYLSSIKSWKISYLANRNSCFNSTLVQLKGVKEFDFHSLKQSFNSTLVQLKVVFDYITKVAFY